MKEAAASSRDNSTQTDSSDCGAEKLAIRCLQSKLQTASKKHFEMKLKLIKARGKLAHLKGHCAVNFDPNDLAPDISSESEVSEAEETLACFGVPGESSESEFGFESSPSLSEHVGEDSEEEVIEVEEEEAEEEEEVEAAARASSMQGRILGDVRPSFLMSQEMLEQAGQQSHPGMPFLAEVDVEQLRAVSKRHESIIIRLTDLTIEAKTSS